ncbi:hypothetical protein KCU61_g368, partial [Aureobasidium melanogenum]
MYVGVLFTYFVAEEPILSSYAFHALTLYSSAFALFFANNFLGGVVLLAKTVSSRSDLHARGHGNEVPMTNSGFLRASTTHCSVYAPVIKLPALLISARISKLRRRGETETTLGLRPVGSLYVDSWLVSSSLDILSRSSESSW